MEINANGVLKIQNEAKCESPKCKQRGIVPKNRG